MSDTKTIDFSPRYTKKVSGFKVIRNLFYLSFFIIYGVCTFFIVANFNNIMFAIRRPDIIEAAKKVDAEEERMIKIKIAEIKTSSVKKILTPLVSESK